MLSKMTYHATLFEPLQVLLVFSIANIVPRISPETRDALFIAVTSLASFNSCTPRNWELP